MPSTNIEVDVTRPIPSLEVLDRLRRIDGRVAKNPKDVPGLLARVRELSDDAQQYGLAMRDADAVLAIDPGNAKARAAKVAALVKLGRFDDAEAEFRVLAAAKPDPDLLGEPSERPGGEGAAGASRLDAALEYRQPGDPGKARGALLQAARGNSAKAGTLRGRAV